MAEELAHLLTVLDISSFLLHFIGIYLLLKTYKKESEDSQHILITSLAVSEMFISVFHLLYTWIPYDADIHTYLKNIHFYIFSFMYYISMILITIDRFLDIRLNMKYPYYWNETKTKILLLVLWTFSGCTALTMCLIFHFKGKALVRPHSLYLFLCLDVIFVMVTSVTYGYIFGKYRRSCEPPIPVPNGVHVSVLSAFRRSRRFSIILFLVITFFVFTVIPDIVIFCTVVCKILPSEKLTIITTCRISYAVSRLADAYAYIFMDGRIRKVLVKMSCRKNSVDVERNQAETTDTISTLTRVT